MFENKAWERGSRSCNYQNSLLLKLNMFDALMHSTFVISFNQIVATKLDPFLEASFYCLT